MSVIALDFDGTCVTHEYPKVGRILPGVRETLRILKENKHKLFLWTMRSREIGLADARDFLIKNGIEIDEFNYSPNQFSTSPKQHANLYIDDAACGCPLCHYKDTTGSMVLAVDWRQIAKWLMGFGYISYEQYEEIKDGIDRTYRTEGTAYRPYSI